MAAAVKTLEDAYRRFYDLGYTDKGIAEAIGVSVKEVRKWRSEHYLYPNQKSRRRKIDPEERLVVQCKGCVRADQELNICIGWTEPWYMWRTGPCQHYEPF